MHEIFRRFSHKVSQITGSAWAFMAAFFLIVGWLITGPIFGYTDTWQLVINTFTTIITFLMVFLIQNTQNRDTKAVHIKLDELIRAVKGARNMMIEVEELTDEELELMQAEFKKLHEKAEGELHKRKSGKNNS
jgi:low affinity Fe/Cu permease